jgi:hypothetical protein
MSFILEDLRDGMGVKAASSNCVKHILTLAVISSSQAIRIQAAVAGESSLNIPFSPLSILAAVMASFIAKNTDEARKRGGSPTA